ncbi:MaoC/PaaZ C-terminal domain-containing protein [Modestobacter sp. VKM Ac-2979]|uniref:MaoC family dehydratase n=1 Tax=unclassified Modestobacter TaxID=2643866 RepID=UPI0022AB5017|nr:MULTISPECIES: MaoC/PaaZ C-terminal domain-containing protein [unclassified Modestobacter]MCZ2813331.1 MaoC/PaaZ C-terminal domain-containing protein [Modestobacter sp. VKM Ac-2979]MCZ2842477.1 MaoC/PaaZ C-terminal domain-containing protein [Modestobacter sp. VKM Ac-2980]
MTRTVLDAPPALPALFARAALTARGRSGDLPDTRLARLGVEVDPASVAAYSRVCGFPLADSLPVTYPHLVAFPLQVALMTEREFPLALPGLVHVRNQVDQLRPIGAGEALDVEVWAERFSAHVRGATVDLCASVAAGGAEVWRSRSTYLARGATAPEGAPEADVGVSVGALDRVGAQWRVPGDTGRRYAAVSGDVNPIHLSGVTAKAFGFKRAIAHGMWVKGRTLAALAGRLPDAVSVDVAFRKPLLLPGTVTLSTEPVEGGWDVAVRNAKAGTEHLLGRIRPS